MNRWHGLLIAGLVAFGAGAFFIAGGNDRVLENESPTAKMDPRTETSDGVSRLVVQEIETERFRDEEDASGDSRTDDPGLPLADVELEVVNAMSEPVADAEILIFTRTLPSDYEDIFPPAFHDVIFPQTFHVPSRRPAKTETSGPLGTVVVRIDPATPSFIIARKGLSAGATVIIHSSLGSGSDPMKGNRRLTVYEGVDVMVTVRDGSGKAAADVRVTVETPLSFRTPHAGDINPFEGILAGSEGTTDALGRVHFFAPNIVRDRSLRFQAHPPAGPSEPRSVRVDSSPTHVELTIPKMAPVKIRVVESDGSTVTTPALVSWSFQVSELDPKQIAAGGVIWRCRWETSKAKAAIRPANPSGQFELVGAGVSKPISLACGVPIFFRVRMDGRSDTVTSRSISESEIPLIVDLPAGALLPRVRFDVLDQDGKAITLPHSCSTWFLPGRGGERLLEPITQGGLSPMFVLQNPEPGTIEVRRKIEPDEWVARARRGEPVDRPYEIAASFTVEDLMPGVDLDLGDVVIQADAVLAAGRVVDSTGQPVSGAILEVDTAERVDQHPSTLELNLRWNAVSDADGRFTLRGRIPEGTPLVIEATSMTSKSQRFRFRAGTKDLEILCAGTGEFSGSLVYRDPDLLPTVALLAAGPDGKKHRPQLAAGGGFTFQNLPQGSYEILLLTENSKTPVRRFQDITVRPGEESSPAILQQIQIEDSCEFIRVRVFDMNGVAVTNASVMVRGSLQGHDYHDDVPTDMNGEAKIMRPKTLPLRVAVMGAGMPSAVLEDQVDFPITVELRTRVSFVLEIDPGLPPCKHGPWLLLLAKPRQAMDLDHFARNTRSSNHFSGTEMPFQEVAVGVGVSDRQTEFEVQNPGRYLIVASPRGDRTKPPAKSWCVLGVVDVWGHPATKLSLDAEITTELQRLIDALP